MKKRHIIINILPLLIWVLWFFIAQSESLAIAVTYLSSSMLLLPLIFTVYNFIVTKKGTHFLMLAGIFALVNLSGYFLSNGYYLTNDLLFIFKKEYSSVLFDSKVQVLINFMYIAFTTFIAWIVFVNKKEEKVEIC